MDSPGDEELMAGVISAWHTEAGVSNAVSPGCKFLQVQRSFGVSHQFLQGQYWSDIDLETFESRPERRDQNGEFDFEYDRFSWQSKRAEVSLGTQLGT